MISVIRTVFERGLISQKEVLSSSIKIIIIVIIQHIQIEDFLIELITNIRVCFKRQALNYEKGWDPVFWEK